MAVLTLGKVHRPHGKPSRVQDRRQEIFYFVERRLCWCADLRWCMTQTEMSEIWPLAEARKLLASITSPPEAVEIARQVLALLDLVEERITDRSGPLPRAVRRGATAVVYAVERSALGETLAEHRPAGNAQPFRCPRPVYDAVVTALADAKKPMSTAEIAAEVEKRTGMKPANHQFRVPIRLFLHVDPPLIIRNRARYIAASRRTVRKAAAQLWLRMKAKNESAG